jgi:hypothetical protein
MSCLLVKQNLIAIMEKTLPAEKQKVADQHLAMCNSCQELYRKVLETYQSLGTVSIPETSPYFYSRVIAKLENNSEKDILFPWPVIRTLRPLVAGLAILTGVTFSLVFGNYFLVSPKVESTTLTTATVNTFSNEYYLDNNEEVIVDLFINNK